MLQKITDYVREFHMIEAGDGIVAGVSGGADSVCLFQILLELQKKIPFSFCVVHVNHGIRQEAGEDAAYVQRLCKAHEIAFFQVNEDVPALAQEQHLSEEEAGRMVRYRVFAEIAKKQYGERGKIAVAHNQNDRAETVLFQLFRGSGIEGMTGMSPVNGQIIRPLLCVSREEIEAYLEERQIPYQTDATNEHDDYARNRIRHHILPYAEEQICAGSTQHISKMAELLGQAADYLRGQTELAYDSCVTNRPDGQQALLIEAAKWQALDAYIGKSLVHLCFERLTPHAKDITSQHVEAVCELFDKQAGKSLNLPYRLRAYRDYTGILLVQQGDGAASADKMPEGADIFVIPHMQPEGETVIGTLRMRWRVFENTDFGALQQNIPKNECTKWFDYDKIKESIGLRHRKTGDFLCVNQAGGTKSVKEYMIHEKIPQRQRDTIWLLADGSHVLWIVGYRISQTYKVSSQTKNIIEIQIEEDT